MVGLHTKFLLGCEGRRTQLACIHPMPFVALVLDDMSLYFHSLPRCFITLQRLPNARRCDMHSVVGVAARE